MVVQEQMLLPSLPFLWTTAASSPDVSFLLLAQHVTTTVCPALPKWKCSGYRNNPLFKGSS
eukprot:10346222-Prorocentrum_lima.AAC.1